MPPPLVPRDSSYRSMVSGPSFTPTARATVRLAWPLRVRPSREEYERSASTSTTSPSSGSRSSRNDTPVLVTANRPAATASRRIASADSPDTSMVRVTANDRAVRETSSSARTVTGSDPSGSARVRSTLILAPAAALPGLSVLRPVRRSGSLPARSRRAIPVPRSPPAARPTESRLLSGTRSSAVPRAYGATPSPPSTPPAAVGGRPNTVSPASEEPATSEPTSGRKSCVIGGWGGGDPPCSRLRGRAPSSRRRTSTAMCCRTAPMFTTRAVASYAGVPQPYTSRSRSDGAVTIVSIRSQWTMWRRCATWNREGSAGSRRSSNSPSSTAMSKAGREATAADCRR